MRILAILILVFAVAAGALAGPGAPFPHDDPIESCAPSVMTMWAVDLYGVVRLEYNAKGAVDYEASLPTFRAMIDEHNRWAPEDPWIGVYGGLFFQS